MFEILFDIVHVCDATLMMRIIHSNDANSIRDIRVHSRIGVAIIQLPSTLPRETSLHRAPLIYRLVSL